MAEIILSSLVDSVIGHLTSSLLDEFRALRGVCHELEKHKTTLTTIQDVLQDAEERQVKSNSVRNWLLKLKDVAYDADNVLDEFRAEGLRLKVEGETHTRKRKSWNPVTNFALSFLVLNPDSFERDMANKIKEIRDRLDEIAKERHALHLREGDGGRRPEIKLRPHTSSLIDHSHDFVGMGGLGKTALAQLVYNDETVVNHFELRMWVCVSEDFDVRRLTISILESERAFVDGNLDAHPKLANGEKIVKKCKGLPLATKTLGGLLYANTNANEWDNIFKSEIWDLPEDRNNILPALRLSYHYLPTSLKQCFVYCSVFPKDHLFEKDQLVQLWIAQGFIDPEECDIGSEYPIRYQHTMHDIMHDLAQSIASDECFRTESIESWRNHEKALYHSSFHCRDKDPLIFEACNKSKGLRTLLFLGNIPSNINLVLKDVFLNLSSLRVLDLRGLRINELPNSISNLKHLRYLDLSNNSICSLPESTSSLYNLQILKLRECECLCELPNDIRNLINLRHLYFDTRLEREQYCLPAIESFPPGIGKLTCLQTLSEFVVGSKESGNGIGELKDLINLRGAIEISHLDRVRNGEEAKVANLKNKKHLCQLTFSWKTSSEDDQEVLESLQPHTNLEILRIYGYGGVHFPSWIGDSQFYCVVKITLVSCSGCKVVPPLGQLPLLQSLSMGKIYALKHIGREFIGCDRGKGFPSLEMLQLNRLNGLEEWYGVQEGEFPCLHQVTINGSSKLRQLPHLPAVRELTLSNCPELIALPRLAKMKIAPRSHTIWAGLLLGVSDIDKIVKTKFTNMLHVRIVTAHEEVKHPKEFDYVILNHAAQNADIAVYTSSLSLLNLSQLCLSEFSYYTAMDIFLLSAIELKTGADSLIHSAARHNNLIVEIIWIAFALYVETNFIALIYLAKAAISTSHTD
ncbi:putative disease resistance protein RGA3 [Tasmannia lanceolata]|uniref:putative disease resistance protein RGA3 n=1 Tax=Tasmannia lanceolata TaxID=3420 RepID=UPI0040629DD5